MNSSPSSPSGGEHTPTPTQVHLLLFNRIVCAGQTMEGIVSLRCMSPSEFKALRHLNKASTDTWFPRLPPKGKTVPPLGKWPIILEFSGKALVDRAKLSLLGLQQLLLIPSKRFRIITL